MDAAENSRLEQRLAGLSPTFTTAQACQALLSPRAVVCGESAVALHELIDDISAAVHITVGRGTRRPTISYPPTVGAQYAVKAFCLGIERFEAAPGETIPVYNAARSGVGRPHPRHHPRPRLQRPAQPGPPQQPIHGRGHGGARP